MDSTGIYGTITHHDTPGALALPWLGVGHGTSHPGGRRGLAPPRRRVRLRADCRLACSCAGWTCLPPAGAVCIRWHLSTLIWIRVSWHGSEYVRRGGRKDKSIAYTNLEQVQHCGPVGSGSQTFLQIGWVDGPAFLGVGQFLVLQPMEKSCCLDSQWAVTWDRLGWAASAWNLGHPPAWPASAAAPLPLPPSQNCHGLEWEPFQCLPTPPPFRAGEMPSRVHFFLRFGFRGGVGCLDATACLLDFRTMHTTEHYTYLRAHTCAPHALWKRALYHIGFAGPHHHFPAVPGTAG